MSVRRKDERKGWYIPNSFIKHTLQIPLRQRRTLQILMCPNLLGHRKRLFIRHRLHLLRPQRLSSGSVFSQIQLCSNENDGHARCVVLDFGVPFGFYVVKGWRRDDGEADEEDVGLRVGQGAETVVVFLTGCIPESEADGSAVDHDAGGVVVKPVVVSMKAPKDGGEGGTDTVGMYSPGKALVVYDIRRHVCARQYSVLSL